MFAGIIQAEFSIPGARSLKDKRKPLRSLKDKLRNRFNCAVAEVAFHDKWQRAGIGISTVGAEEKFVQTVLDEIRRSLETIPGMQLLSCGTEIIDANCDPLSRLL